MDAKAAFRFPAALILRAQPRFEYAREPLLRRMPNGDLLCVFLSGGHTEPDNQNFVIAVRSQDDGISWSEPQVLFRHGERAVWATELFCEGNTVCLFVMTYYAPSRYRELILYRSFSYDDGKTWTQPQSLPNGLLSGSVRQGVALNSGRWVFPFYWQECLDGWDWTVSAVPNGGIDPRWPFRCGALISDDRGKSFDLRGYLTADIPLWENNVCEYAPGKLVMLMRAEYTGRLYRSFSDDDGQTWSPAQATDIPNPASKITLLKIEDKTVLIHNPTASTAFCDWRKRTPLSLWVSLDGTRTWSKKVDLCEMGESFFYPHGFWDPAARQIYLACENGQEHYLLKIPGEVL